MTNLRRCQFSEICVCICPEVVPRQKHRKRHALNACTSALLEMTGISGILWNFAKVLVEPEAETFFLSRPKQVDFNYLNIKL